MFDLYVLCCNTSSFIWKIDVSSLIYMYYVVSYAMLHAMFYHMFLITSIIIFESEMVIERTINWNEDQTKFILGWYIDLKKDQHATFNFKKHIIFSVHMPWTDNLIWESLLLKWTVTLDTKRRIGSSLLRLYTKMEIHLTQLDALWQY
jgi:hypothetical protein